MTEADLGCGVRETIWALRKKVKQAEERAEAASDAEIRLIVQYLRREAGVILGNALGGDGIVDRCESAAEALELAAEAIEAREHWQ